MSDVWRSFINLILVANLVSGQRYEPNWESLDSRPLPSWYDEVKIGIFIHWGVYSVPGFGSEWFWNSWHDNSSDYVDFMSNNYPERFTYQDFASDFKAEFYNPDQWADLFEKSGAKYVVLTSKHHEGYTMWPSKYSFSWNAQDVGPKRNLLGDLATAVRKRNLIFGLYHSLFEWYNPLYVSDKNSQFETREFVDTKVLPELRDVVETYEPWIVWSDGDWEAPDSYWNSTGFLSWLYNESPVKDKVVTNDRWGIDIACNHGGFLTCSDRYNPGTVQERKWENAMTIDKYSWGYRRNAHIQDYLTTHDLIRTLIETISCGGNILINVGPTKEGLISPVFEERLLELGEWLEINGEAIYNSNPWSIQNDTLTSGIWYTQRNGTVFATVLEWPADNKLSLESPVVLLTNVNSTISLLGNEESLQWAVEDGVVNINFPDRATVENQMAWVLKIVS